MQKIIAKISAFYDTIKDRWESKKSRVFMSNFLVLSFLIGIVFTILLKLQVVQLQSDFFKHSFFAIEISFTLLLIFELFNLIFVLPKSVAKSNNKQYELLSLIFLRSGFKEFSHIENLSDWSFASETLLNMLAFGLGGLLIFIIVNITDNLQKHVQLTANEVEQVGFVQSKKILALLLFFAFIVIGLLDLITLVNTGVYVQSFETFYTILIFSDILIVLISLRYSTEYLRIFRYSAFVLATIIIRISFSLKTYESVIVGVSGAVFVLLLTFSYNHFLKINNSKKTVE